MARAGSQRWLKGHVVPGPLPPRAGRQRGRRLRDYPGAPRCRGRALPQTPPAPAVPAAAPPRASPARCTPGRDQAGAAPVEPERTIADGWKLRVLPSAEGGLGQEPLVESLQGQRLVSAGPAPFQCVRREVKEHLARERVVSRVQGCKPAQHLEDVGVMGEPVEQGMTGGHGVLRSRSLPARHIATVDQNRQPCAAFAAAARHRDHVTR